MSHSPAASLSNSSESVSKKRKTTVSGDLSMAASSQQPHIPKRGARACTSCRKGKNRCEGEAPCRRCQASGTPCIFEKPEKKNAQGLSTASIERLSRLEGQYLVMQSQMIGMQSSLDRILSVVQTQNGNGPHPQLYPPHMEAHRDGNSLTHHRNGFDAGPAPAMRSFPPLPGFAPPPHKYASYGIVPSTAPSSDDESEDTLPRASLNAPIEALQGLANAAAEAAAAPSAEPPRVKKRKRAEPIPKNAFPHVVEKGLVTDSEARELF